VILVDSSVWIDYLRGVATPQADKLDSLLGTEPLAVGDLILAEVLQGCGSEREFSQVRQALDAFTLVELGGKEVAIQAAKNFRTLRAKGVTVRKTIDTIIATRCILDGHSLLHADRDFDAFEAHLGLRVVSSEA
jgi:predicted nucleic acid-binding protein